MAKLTPAQHAQLMAMQRQAAQQLAATRQSLAAQLFNQGAFNGIGQPFASAFSGPGAQPGLGAGAYTPNPFIAAIHHARALAAAESAGPKPALESAGISVGELVGYRIWRLRREDRLLESFSAERIWLPGEPMTGEPGDHDSAGVWAFKEGFDAANKLRDARNYVDPYHSPLEFVLGSVWLWGSVVEHDIGWRAEFARVRSIDACPHTVASYELGRADETATFLQFHTRRRRREGETIALLSGDERTLDALRQRYGVGSMADAEPEAERPEQDEAA